MAGMKIPSERVGQVGEQVDGKLKERERKENYMVAQKIE